MASFTILPHPASTKEKQYYSSSQGIEDIIYN